MPARFELTSEILYVLRDQNLMLCVYYVGREDVILLIVATAIALVITVSRGSGDGGEDVLNIEACGSREGGVPRDPRLLRGTFEPTKAPTAVPKEPTASPPPTAALSPGAGPTEKGLAEPGVTGHPTSTLPPSFGPAPTAVPTVNPIGANNERYNDLAAPLSALSCSEPESFGATSHSSPGATPNRRPMSGSWRATPCNSA